jgi:hypothetical protein
LALANAGDLILDVVRAADPSAVEAARTRLAAFATKSAPAPQNPAAKPATPEAFVRFEAMVLQTFIQNMLPDDTESVYGAGMAGEMWQSMLAEQLGATMARRGGIGIAERVLGNHYVTGPDDTKTPVQGVSADPDRPALDEQLLLSAALIHEIQRRAAREFDESQE